MIRAYSRDGIVVETCKCENDDPYDGYDEKNEEQRDLEYDVVYQADEAEREDQT